MEPNSGALIFYRRRIREGKLKTLTSRFWAQDDLPFRMAALPRLLESAPDSKLYKQWFFTNVVESKEIMPKIYAVTSDLENIHEDFDRMFRAAVTSWSRRDDSTEYIMVKGLAAQWLERHPDSARRAATSKSP